MVSPALPGLWTDVDAAWWKAEEQRQAFAGEKILEARQISSARESHRQKACETDSARKRILDEMRQVRSNVQAKMINANSRGGHNMGVANRALARAGQNALSANIESERWQARAKDVQAVSASTSAREREKRAVVQEASKARVASAHAHASDRVDHGQRLVQETADLSAQIQNCHAEHCATQEKHAEGSAQLKMKSATRAQQEASMKVRAAIAKSSKEQMVSMREIQKSREVATVKVAAAKQQFLEQRLECEATLERERICSAQARKIAATLKQQQEQDRQEELKKLEDRLNFTARQAQTKADNYEADTDISRTRLEAWTLQNNRSVDAAKVRASEEEVKAVERVNAAKVGLSKLQAQCAAYIRNLVEQWEAAKRDDAAKVDAADKEARELSEYCEETLRACKEYCAKTLQRTEKHAEAAKSTLTDKVAMMGDLAKQRVTMMQQQSRERRQQAEAQLADFQKHVKEVQARCNERVIEEAETAEEKVRICRDRCDQESARALQRAAEAEARRDKARAAHAAVMARCMGAAREARRRGLNNIADIIEPPLFLEEPGVVGPDASGESVLLSNLLSEEASPAKSWPGEGLTEDQHAEKDPLMGTGMTGTTALPEDQASLATTMPRDQASLASR